MTASGANGCAAINLSNQSRDSVGRRTAKEDEGAQTSVVTKRRREERRADVTTILADPGSNGQQSEAGWHLVLYEFFTTTLGEIESEFHTYVQPQEHPILSEFCTELTGIKQQQVEDGVPLKICLSQFSNWIQKLQKERGIIFPNVLPNQSCPEQKMCAFVTWSDWDLGVCLLYECKRKQLRKTEILNSWIDLRLTYKVC
ncbi:hypothetical protein AB205_0202610 [Aquarana catesbeiana]|uniref:Exonuclease domain-containing protein n=1 Tax=Aquarana catesbeiana TaxID=8400 RepID=A0A2G9S3N2_AQUCT|nr:hypothetical protein AB205_0202610 [Aquarana catesbeiana]